MSGSASRLGLLVSLLLHGCGDDSAAAADASGPETDASISPAPDSGALPECVHVDGRGGAEADGSATSPFATLDDALAAALESAAPVAICLGAGEHAPPTRALRGGLTLGGPSSDNPADRAVVRGSVGPCLRAEGLDLGDPEGPGGDVMTALLVEGDAPTTLRDLDVMDCDVGIVARGAGGVVIEGVGIRRTMGGVVIDRGSAGTLRDLDVSHGFRPPAAGTQALPAGASAGEGARLSIYASRFESAAVPSVGVLGGRADLELEDVAIEGHTSWLVVQQNDGHGVTLRGVRLRRQTAVATLDPWPAVSDVEGGTLEADDLQLEGSDERGLQLVETDVTLRGFRASGITSAALVAYGGTVQLSGDTTLDMPEGRSYGLVAGRSPAGASARISVGGALQSSAEPDGVHLVARNGGSIELDGSAALRGGSFGAAVDAGGRLVARGALTVESPSSSAVVARGAESTVELDGLAVRQADVLTRAAGVVALDGSSVSMNGGALHGGSLGFLCAACTAADLRDVSIEETTHGLAFYDTPADVEQIVTGLSVRASRGPGVLVAGAWQVTLEACSVFGNTGAGIEAQDGATLRVDGCELGNNAGAAVALYDASAAILRSTFEPSIPAFFGSSAVPRADEIRIVSTTGATREVFVGDDGDRTFAPGEGNLFRLLGSRACGDGGCSLVFADGPGAVGIVTPNCLTTDMGAAGVFSLVEQRSATFEFVGTSRAFWSGQLAGIGVDLGLDEGVAAPSAELAGFGAPDLSALDSASDAMGR